MFRLCAAGFIILAAAMAADVAAPSSVTFDIFRDTGFKNVDFPVFKDFKFKERIGAEFRFEVFNLFSHPRGERS